MTATEKKYLVKRIDDMWRDHNHKIFDEEANARDAYEKTTVHKLKNGASLGVELRKYLIKQQKTHGPLRIDYNKEISVPANLVIQEEVQPFDGTPYLERANKLSNRTNQIKDEIMLGDADEALKLIAKFQKESF